ncbi:Uncharacterised protein [Bordetella pertussis]|nr:Uncharacterised protein [Bordetella pertussis]
MPGGLLREGAITAVLRGVTVLALRTWADMASADGAVLRRQP